MPEDNPPRSCLRVVPGRKPQYKVRFDSNAAASAWVNASGQHAHYETYLCSHCHYWHVGKIKEKA